VEDVKAIVEALILASETPLSIDKMVEVLGDTDKKAIDGKLQELTKEYEQRGGGICLKEVAGGFQFRTRSDLAPWIKKLRGVRFALTPAALETLSVIAYRQPVLKSEIDNIRGVDAGGPIKKLLEKKLVRIVGRKDVPGKPIIYGTTKRFLEVFNLRDLSELPTLREIKELED
jgi:segregation and condensation protein B